MGTSYGKAICSESKWILLCASLLCFAFTLRVSVWNPWLSFTLSLRLCQIGLLVPLFHYHLGTCLWNGLGYVTSTEKNKNFLWTKYWRTMKMSIKYRGRTHRCWVMVMLTDGTAFILHGTFCITRPRKLARSAQSLRGYHVRPALGIRW